MKSLFRFTITKILVAKARQVLKKHRTQVIAVTGSVGKTSTKEAAYNVIKNQFKTYRSAKGFNTELGLSLAILQEDQSGFSSPLAWLKILKRVLFKPKEVYQKIILEMGADKPGDIKKLLKIAQPAIGVVTAVAPVHLADGQFKDVEAIAREKAALVEQLPKEGVAILNDDDPLVRDMKTGTKKILYGMRDTAQLRASDIHVTSKNIRFKVTYQEQTEKCVVPVLGSFQVYVLLPAIAVGLKLGMTLKRCVEALEVFQTPPGRMNPIQGINKSHIIDSSYNASPITMTSALELLQELNAERKVAALGTMNELGEMNKEAHLTLGQQAAQVADLLIAVGSEAATIKQGAMEAGMKESDIYTFFDSEEAGAFLKYRLQPKDLILIKGSQNRVRMEKLVKIIMEHPERASGLLCRQEEAWESI